MEKSASMNGTPIQSPIPMRRKYRLLNQCKANMDNKSGNPNSIGLNRGQGEGGGGKKRDTSSLPRNFYIRYSYYLFDRKCHHTNLIFDCKSAQKNLPETKEWPKNYKLHLHNNKVVCNTSFQNTSTIFTLIHFPQI